MSIHANYEQSHSCIRNAWKKFINGEQTQPEVVRDVVLRSWERCKNLEVNPYQKIAPLVLTKSELNKRLEANRKLVDISLPVMTHVLECVQGSGFIVALADSEGYILKIFGDSNVADQTTYGNFREGALWSESAAGTNGIATVIHEDRPLQINGPEHYCLCSHNWSCSGAPIHDCDGNIIGALDMTGRWELSHPHTLGIVAAAAKAIEKQIALNHTLEAYRAEAFNKSVLMDSVFDGLIAVDNTGKITHMNHSAEKLLGLEPSNYIGTSIASLPFDTSSIQKILNSSQEIADYETIIKNRHGNKLSCVITCRNINICGEKTGRLLAINNTHRIRNMARKIAGTTARITFDDIIGQSSNFLQAVKIAQKGATAFANVLILGESGTGKDLFAQAIHNASFQRNGPFVAVNCAAIPRDLIASELFGYNEGAFTGARKGGNPGKFELADGGTIFLDEIGDMPLHLQTMLLRVIENKTITRVGGNSEIPVNVRVIAATNKDLFREVEKGNFRADLFYRLNVVLIKIPPLRERPKDIPLLIDYFIKRIAKQNNIKPLSVSDSQINMLTRYKWPGNVRQLQNLIERSYYIGSNTILLPDEINSIDTPTVLPETSRSLEEYERELIENLLNKHNYSITVLAKNLGVARSTIYRKMKRYGISR